MISTSTFEFLICGSDAILFTTWLFVYDMVILKEKFTLLYFLGTFELAENFPPKGM